MLLLPAKYVFSRVFVILFTRESPIPWYTWLCRRFPPSCRKDQSLRRCLQLGGSGTGAVADLLYTLTEVWRLKFEKQKSHVDWYYNHLNHLANWITQCLICKGGGSSKPFVASNKVSGGHSDSLHHYSHVKWLFLYIVISGYDEHSTSLHTCTNQTWNMSTPSNFNQPEFPHHMHIPRDQSDSIAQSPNFSGPIRVCHVWLIFLLNPSSV